jgi:Zn-dependent peptidase ImmA (M78 family)/transcriptional regulator with XRE-family HTH domain
MDSFTMDSNLIKTIDSRQLGKRLKEARKARGLTQEAVASALGILRTTLVAIEKGDRQVTPDELISMAKMFGRAVSEFVAKRANKTPFLPQFRLPSGQHNVAESDLTAAAVELENLARDYVELEERNSTIRRANFPATYIMEVPGATPEQRGEEVAAEERTRLGLGDGPITDLRSLLEEAAGVRVFYINLPSCVGGLFACNDELGACIAINAGHPSARGNWSLSHEYGHFLTTRYQADVSFTHDHWGKQTAERFADSFAKHFLMPRMGVLRRLSDAVNAHGKGVTVGDVMALAHLYRVSAEAMFHRLEELKRIPFGTWNGLREKRGFKPEQARAALGLSNESREPMLPLRYRLLAASAYQNKELLTEGQLAKKLRSDRVAARLELEALNLMTDDAGVSDAKGFLPIELDASELIKL